MKDWDEMHKDWGFILSNNSNVMGMGIYRVCKHP